MVINGYRFDTGGKRRPSLRSVFLEDTGVIPQVCVARLVWNIAFVFDCPIFHDFATSERDAAMLAYARWKRCCIESHFVVKQKAVGVLHPEGISARSGQLMKMLTESSPSRSLENKEFLITTELSGVGKRERYDRVESFAARSFTFPEGAVAEFSDGVLKVHLSTSPEARRKFIDSRLHKRRQVGEDNVARPLAPVQMRTVISINEVVASFHHGESKCEVWASAYGSYDETNSRLVVILDSMVQRSSDNQPIQTNWLPDPQTVISVVPLAEGTSLAKEMFRHWVKRVHQAAPINARAEAPGARSMGVRQPHKLIRKPIDTVGLAARFDLHTGSKEPERKQISV